MGRHFRHPCVASNITKRLVDIEHGRAIPLDCAILSEFLPAPKMRQKAPRQWDWWAALFCLTCARRATIENPLLQIDPAAPLSCLKRSGAYGRSPRASVERHQDEARDVPPRPPARGVALLMFAEAPCCPEQSRYLRSSTPALSPSRLLREHNADDLFAMPFDAVVIDRGPQH